MWNFDGDDREDDEHDGAGIVEIIFVMQSDFFFGPDYSCCLTRPNTETQILTTQNIFG